MTKGVRSLYDHKLLKLADQVLGDASLFKRWGRSSRLYDEPFLYQYFTETVDLKTLSAAPRGSEFGGGASFDQDRAKIKATGEGIERFCLAVYREEDLVKATQKELGDKAIDINEVVSISGRQKEQKKFSDFLWDENTKFYWVKGRLLAEDKMVFIPAQLVFLPYKFWKEKIIRFPISTGAAAHTTLENALLGGILEVVERDAFMIHYLAKTWGEYIDISGNKKLQDIRDYFKKYRLDVHLINLPTDLPVYTFLSLLLDETGVGPAVSAGMKTGFEPESVAVRAIEESWHSRPWIREALNKRPNIGKIMERRESVQDIRERGILWSPPSMLAHIKPWIKNKRRVKFKKIRDSSKGSTNKELDFILEALNKDGHHVYSVDVTAPQAAKYGFIVVKVIIPTLHPLFLEQPYPYHGGRRIYEVPVKLGYRKSAIEEEELNTFPHFFL